MKAIILSAGEGTRLKPLTESMPKVLLPINGKPMIEYTISWLKNYGITEIAINLHYLGNKIVEHLLDGKRYGVKIHYSREDTLLGTSGGVKKLQSYFTETFLVVYGDVLTNFSLNEMIEFHKDMESVATLSLIEMRNRKDVGRVLTDESGRIQSFIEKPTTSKWMFGNGGIYILEPEIFNYIPDGFSDFAADVFPNMIAQGASVYGHLLTYSTYLSDVGTIRRYYMANQDVKDGRISCCL